MAVPFDFIPTESFYFALGVLVGGSREKTTYIDEKLGTALRELELNGAAGATPHGSGGDKFSVPIDQEYILVFRWETDRDEQKHPIADHYWLLTIERK